MTPGAKARMRCALLLVLAAPACAGAWGAAGHAIIARAAVAACPDLPPWFRAADGALASLANAPDRWREIDERLPALAARRSEHFFDRDLWPEAIPADRGAYLTRAARRRLDPMAIGFLPFATLEEWGVLVSAFRDVRGGRPGAREAALVAAGALAHWAGDAVVPLHATRHHHGWVGANPEGFTRDRRIHAWFETDLVDRLETGSVHAGPEAGRLLPDVATAVQVAIDESLALVPRVYRVERRSRDGDDAEAIALARTRLAAGATLVARLWRTAWARSGR
jgi:hypothetical protein